MILQIVKYFYIVSLHILINNQKFLTKIWQKNCLNHKFGRYFMKKIIIIFVIFCVCTVVFADIICDRCGSSNPDGSMFCQDCGARLIKSSKSAATKSTIEDIGEQNINYSQEKICPSCKTKNPSNAKFCQNCGAKLTEEIKQKITDESNIKSLNSHSTKTALLLSVLFPGVGQIYIGEKTKGIILTSVSGGLILSSLLVWNYAESIYKDYETTLDPVLYDDYSTNIDIANFLLVAYFGVWVYNMVDIYLTTSKINKSRNVLYYKEKFKKSDILCLNLKSKEIGFSFIKKF